MRNLHPRWPLLYGGFPQKFLSLTQVPRFTNPIRPVVSFYNTPLQALHKVLATYLKPLAQNPLRLKDSSDSSGSSNNDWTPPSTPPTPTTPPSMCSPSTLPVELAEIRLAEVETLALSSSPDSPSSYSHFVDDGCGAFRNKDHAETYLSFLNSLASLKT